MSENRLFFGEAPSLAVRAGRYEASGLLSVWDDEQRENTFQVLVSGEYEDEVQDFIRDPQKKCIFLLEVQPEPSLSEVDEVLTDESSSPFLLNPRETTLLISIAPQEITTPRPCRISYHIFIDRVVPYSLEQIDLGKGKTHQEITFQRRQAEVQCTVETGKVEVWLEEEIAGKFERRGESQILSGNPNKQPVWVPGPTRGNPYTSRSGESVRWRVAITGQQADNKCTIIYDAIVRRVP